jgi:ATP citrate (pro-S)-lyase
MHNYVFFFFSPPPKGDRFGGALDGAARQFSEAYDSGLHPMEFVNSMRKKGQLIMGIGHRVKSVSKCQ